MGKTISSIVGVFTLLFLSVIVMAPTYLEPLREFFVVHILRLVLLGWILKIITDMFYKSVLKNNSIKEWIKNTALSLYMILVLLVCIEVAFMFVPVSQSTSYTLAGRNWFYYYWEKNSRGFRDTEINEKELSKKKIFFLGDSFTAGHGIKKESNRFSNIAGEKLKPTYEFFNIGRNGADTDDEYNLLTGFPVKPDVLVLQYFFNDIENATRRAGLFQDFPLLYDDIPLWQRPLVRGSFLLNFIYWKFPHNGEYDYLAQLNKAYNTPVVLNDHITSIKKITDHCKSNNIKLYVVLFPFLQDLEVSKKLAVPVKNFFISQGIHPIDVSNLVNDLPVEKRVVNLNDFHASPLVNERVANEIVKLVIN